MESKREGKRHKGEFSLKNKNWVKAIYKSHVMNVSMKPGNLAPENYSMWPCEESLRIAANRYTDKELPVLFNHTEKRIGTVQQIWTDLKDTTLWVTMYLNEEGANLALTNKWCSPLFTLVSRINSSIPEVQFHDFSLVPDGGLNFNTTYRGFSEEKKLRLAACRASDEVEPQIMKDTDGNLHLQITFAAARIMDVRESVFMAQEVDGIITFVGTYGVGREEGGGGGGFCLLVFYMVTSVGV